jgi:hypothetical protein
MVRHTYASHAIMDGMPIEVLSKQLGHKDLRITMKHYEQLCKTFKQTLVRQHAPSFGFAWAGARDSDYRERLHRKSIRRTPKRIPSLNSIDRRGASLPVLSCGFSGS